MSWLGLIVLVLLLIYGVGYAMLQVFSYMIYKRKDR